MNNINEKIDSYFLDYQREMTISFGSLSVGLKFDDYNTKWLIEYFRDFYDTNKIKKSKWLVRLKKDKIFYKQLDDIKDNQEIGDYLFFRQKISESNRDFTNFIFLNKVSKRLLILVNDYSHELDYQLVRNIRTIINLESIIRGDLHLHASAISLHQKAVIFLGDKFQGKTTAWLNLCHHPKVKYISNDHVIIKNKARVFGVPTSIGIRQKTLTYFPKLKDYLYKNKPKYIFQDSPSIDDKKIYFLVKELLNKINSSINSNSKAKLIIFPYYNPKINFVKTSLIDSDQLDINELIITDPCEHAPYWNEIFHKKLNRRANRKRLLEFADKYKIKIYRLEYNENLFLDFYEEICRLLGHENNTYIYHKAKKVAYHYLADCRRKDNRKMTLHLERIVKILKKADLNDKYLFTLAFLHDILEESDMDKKFLADNFGEKIKNDISSLTIYKIKNECFDEEMNRMSKKLLEASDDAILVKIADRLDNVEDMTTNSSYFKPYKIERYKLATKKILSEILIPRVGNNKISDKLQHILK